MPRQLALFDLDNTLLDGDSDHAFGEFLIRKNLVDSDSHRTTNDRFYQQYLDNNLDIHAYVAFTLKPVIALTPEQLRILMAEFSREVIANMVSTAATELVDWHRQRGDHCVIITATNELITAPLAAAFQVDTLLATELHWRADRPTGKIKGTPCYRDGKVERLQSWLAKHGEPKSLNLEHSVFYSDSINDLPLLERVAEPVVVNPDARLAAIAEQRHWARLDLHVRG